MKSAPFSIGVGLVLGLALAFGGVMAQADDVNAKAANANDPNSETPVRDAVTTARIETIYLMNGELNPFDINTTTNDGVVSLDGTVREQADKDLAERLAKSVKEVKSVVNNLKVDRNVEASNDNSEWRQSVEDATLNSRVRRRLAYHSGIEDAMLNINATNGQVTITGEVDSDEKKDTIERIAKNTAGVRSVESNMTVNPNAGNDVDVDNDADNDADNDSTITDAISDEFAAMMVRSSIAWSRDLSIFDIDVAVEDGVCVLTGTVESAQDRDMAESIAAVTDGVTAVTNELEIEGA